MPRNHVPSYLRPLGEAGEWTATILPSFYQEELLGLLAVSRSEGAPDTETFVQVRRLADQIAVALANARMVDQVRFLAFYDSLTRLPNRVLFKERLAHVLARAERGRKRWASAFSTWTISAGSTTPWATRWATGSCRRWPAA